MKLHCLRVQFHTNMRKYVANNCTDEAWWCFKDLMFLKDFVVLRKKMVDGLYDADDLELDFNSPDFGKVSQVYSRCCTRNGGSNPLFNLLNPYTFSKVTIFFCADAPGASTTFLIESKKIRIVLFASFLSCLSHLVLRDT